MMTRDYAEIYSIPRVPGIYAFHVGGSRVKSIAYVGSTGNLRNRVSQHLEYRDSSVTTGASAAVLNPDYIDSCTWWTHPSFADRLGRESAELIAFDVLNIAGYHLKNRGIRSCIPAPVSERRSVGRLSFKSYGTIFAKFFYGIFGELRVFSLDLQTLVVVGVQIVAFVGWWQFIVHQGFFYA